MTSLLKLFLRFEILVVMVSYFLLFILLLVTQASSVSVLTNKYSNAYRDVPEIIQHYGYDVEVHHVTSEDGYITALHRLPFDKNDPKYKGPVIVIHPLLTSSAVWVISGKNSSLAFLLNSEGYDVWLMNLRGNYYSKGHVSLSPKDPRFWNFSYHESGVYDLPSTIDYILDLTENKNLLCVSHSIGSTIAYVTLSLKPQYNQKIRVLFSLSPATACPHARTILKPLPIWSTILKDALTLNDVGEILPKESIDTNTKVQICEKGSLFYELCNYFIFYTQGAPPERVDEATVPIIAGQLPAGTSLNTLAHIGQGVITARFSYFDYGKMTNIKVYGQLRPPLYPVKNIIVPTYIYHGADDTLTTPTDVKRIASKLGNLIERKAIPGFGHADICYGKDADIFIYKPIIDVLSRYPIRRVTLSV